jgi:hypothetical protein
MNSYKNATVNFVSNILCSLEFLILKDSGPKPVKNPSTMINNKEEEIKEKREKALMTPRFSFL